MMCCQSEISMRRIGLALIVMLFSVNISVARYLSPEEAFLRIGKEETSKVLGLKNKAIINPKLLKTITISDEVKAAVYLYSVAPNKIMAVSANDCAPAILGYFDNVAECQSVDNLPPNVEWWLNQYASQIEYVEANPGTEIITANAEVDIPIAPLVTAKWNQSAPYNLKCPIDENGRQAVTGCVATAIAQVMNYHKWPERGSGSHSYTYKGTTYSIDFSEIEFQWDLMLDEYDEHSDSLSCDAVATLMKACGYSVDMQYGYYASGAVTTNIINAGPEYFDYSEDAYYAERNNYTLSQWADLLYDQLSKGLPLIYTGRDGVWLSSTGHCFVCDGCDENGYYHFNWGWGGYCDGYFALTDLTPGGVGIGGSSSGYNVRQGCVVNFYPSSSDKEEIVGYKGQGLNADNTNKTISTIVYPEKIILAKELLTFGLEFTLTDRESSIVLPIGDFPFETNDYKPSYTITPEDLYSLGLTDGSYEVRFVYKDAENWEHLLYYVGSESAVMMNLNASDVQLFFMEYKSPVTISNVRFNGRKLLLRGQENSLTYTATNNSDMPVYWASWHYLIPDGANLSSGTSLYNVNLILAAGESREISRPISASKIENLPNGQYYIAIEAGDELGSEKYIYSDTSVLFDIVDDQVAITDGIYNYVKEGPDRVVMIGLSNPETKLAGEVVIPQETEIGEEKYVISAMLCSISDLIDVSNVISVDIRFPMLTLPNNIFKNATSLTTIKLPESLTAIGSYAFSGCSGLTGNLILPDSVTTIESYAFSGCSGFTGELVLPKKLTKVESGVFSGCSGLTGNLILPDSITSIGYQAFYNCSGLTGDLTLPESVTTIGSHAFYNCSGLTGDLTLPESVTTIGSYAFKNCSGFTRNLTLSKKLTKVESGVFSGCSGLTGNLILPDSITSIGSSAFSGCSGLTGDLTLPKKLTKIESGVFSGCSGLTGNLILPDSITSIGSYVFYNCSGLTGNLILPDSITSIGNSAFSGCSGLTGNLSLPDSLTAIGSYAFSGCSGFTGELVLPKRLTKIESGVFSGCSGFTGNIKIPNSVEKIESYAFYNCKGLTAFISENDIPVTASSSAFSGISTSVPLYVPLGAKEAYANADGWRVFKNIIERDINISFDILTDGVFNYTQIEEDRVVMIGLSNPETKLTGEVVIPQETEIGGEKYVVRAMLCSISDLIDVSNVTSVDIRFPMLTLPNNIFKNATSLTTIKLPESLTAIGSYAFSGCSSLTGGLILPESVTTIGSYAFQNCSGLTGNLILPDSLTAIGSYAFSGCSGFTGDLTLPKKLTKIESGVFSGCSGLTGDLILPDSITSIGSSAFSGCSGLTGDLILPDSLTAIGSYAFSGCSGFTGDLTLPKRLTKIESGVFSGCSGLTGDLILPDSITSIGSSAFSGCSGLTGNLILPESVTTIGSYAFQNCSGFTGNLALPKNLTKIENGVFSGCSGLTGNLILPDSITTIGSYAFSGCSGLTGDLILPDSITSIGSSAFWGCSSLTGDLILPDSLTAIGSYAFSGCSGFTGDLTLPKKLTKIENGVFSGCSGLTGDLILPDSITSIGSEVFYNCSGLTGNLILPDSITSIGSRAFYNCSGFTGNIKIPNSVEKIESYAFYNCKGLTAFISENDIPATASSSAFSGISTSVPLYVPLGAKEAYANADGWRVFKNIIEDVTTGESSLSNGGEVKIYVKDGNIIVVDNGKCLNMGVYDVKGNCIYNGRCTTLSVSNKGLYIVKVENKIIKVTL